MKPPRPPELQDLNGARRWDGKLWVMEGYNPVPLAAIAGAERPRRGGEATRAELMDVWEVRGSA